MSEDHAPSQHKKRPGRDPLEGCFRCRFWDEVPMSRGMAERVKEDAVLSAQLDEVGICRRLPPSAAWQGEDRERLWDFMGEKTLLRAMRVETALGSGCYFPRTHGWDWCGEWQPWHKPPTAALEREK